MISRPAAAILGCTGCRQTLYRAVLSNAAPRLSAPLRYASRRQLPLSQRAFSLSQQLWSDEKNKEIPNETENEESSTDAAAAAESTPWFLDVEPPRHAPSQHIQPLPKVPEDGPTVLEPMIKYIFEDMGLDDISLLDLRELDPPAALGPNLIMLFGTARSERHLHISAGRFVRWLRKNHKIDARADGLIGPGELRTKLRRLRKKAKLMGTNTSIIPRGDNGISTGWICVNFSTEDGSSDASASFDESGRMSGFGASLSGTTVVVQCVTEERRGELDLETLWQGILKRSILQTQKLKGETPPSPEELEKLVSEKLQLPKSESALQWQALQKASQQQRHYSTSARRLSPAASAAQANRTGESGAPTLQEVQRDVEHIQTNGMDITEDVLNVLIQAIFKAEPEDFSSVPTRLALVDRILLTARERGLDPDLKRVFVSLIESITTSPAYGEELEQTQRNIELLLTESGEAQEPEQQLRLMLAYAQRQDWDRFWHIFRIPPRFQQARAPNHYDMAYRAMAATGNSKQCAEALRWVYPEMLKEQPAILPEGSLYESLKACILVADPGAEELLRNPPELNPQDVIGQRKLLRREFVRVLREVEELHLQQRGQQAQQAREELP